MPITPDITRSRKRTARRAPAPRPGPTPVPVDPQVAQVRALSEAGQQEAAIAAASAALAEAAVTPLVRAQLLDARACCHLIRAEVDPAGKDVATLGALCATLTGAEGRQWQARAEMLRARWHLSRGETAEALAAARTTLSLAGNAADQRAVRGEAMLVAVAAKLRARQFDGLVQLAQSAERLCARLGDTRLHARACYRLATALDTQGEEAARNRAAERAIALARSVGDRLTEGDGLNLRWRRDPDLARQLWGLKQCLDAYTAGGSINGRGVALTNLAIGYLSVGHFARSARCALEALAIFRSKGDAAGAANLCSILVSNAVEVGDPEAAARWHEQALAHASAAPEDRIGQVVMNQDAALVARLRGDLEASRRALDAALDLAPDQGGVQFAIPLLKERASVHLARGDAQLALADSTEAVRRVDAARWAMPGGESVAAMYWMHSRVLQANVRRRDADRARERGYVLLQQAIGSLGDVGLRRSYLHRIAGHRNLIEDWVRHARKRKLAHARTCAHLAGAAELAEPFARLVDTGLRLNQLRSAREIEEFVIEEASELLGAQRLLLVLDDADGRRVAGSLLPRGETEAALQQAVGPWLDEARATRVARLRHGPEGAQELDQRSCLVAPLIAGNALLGVIYADIEGLFGRFAEADRDLLTMLAAQAAVALANARTNEGLEAKVAERTAQLEQRAAELAVINTVQQALAGQLDMQAIYEAVGEKLREVFPNRTVILRQVDPASGFVTYP